MGLRFFYKYFNMSVEYLWLKSLCWKGYVMEVGLLVCVLMMYVKKDVVV